MSSWNVEVHNLIQSVKGKLLINMVFMIYIFTWDSSYEWFQFKNTFKVNEVLKYICFCVVISFVFLICQIVTVFVLIPFLILRPVCTMHFYFRTSIDIIR